MVRPVREVDSVNQLIDKVKYLAVCGRFVFGAQAGPTAAIVLSCFRHMVAPALMIGRRAHATNLACSRKQLAMTTTHATTLSPAAAILWAYRFADDGAAQLIPGAEVDATLAAGTGWMWIHVGLADTRCRMWLERHAPISSAAREILLGPDEHLRVDLTNDELAGVLPDLRRDLAQASMEFVRLRFVMTQRMLITARRHPLHSIELTRRSIEGGVRFPTPMSLLDGMIDHFADSIGRLAEQLADELDLIEDHVLRDDLGDERQRIARVRLAGHAGAPATVALEGPVSPPGAAHFTQP